MKKILNMMAALALIALSQGLLAASFTNGNFNTGLTGWDIDGNTSLNNGQVDLSTIGAGGAFADASLIQGDIFNGGFIQLNANDNFLNFNVDYQDLGAGGLTGSIFNDFLQVSVLDEFGTGSTDLMFLSDTDFLFGASSAFVSLDISPLAGLSIGLFFDLFSEDDGRNSLFTLDDISFSQTQLLSRPVVAVPEPGILLLLLPGFMIFSRRLKQNNNN